MQVLYASVEVCILLVVLVIDLFIMGIIHIPFIAVEFQFSERRKKIDG